MSMSEEVMVVETARLAPYLRQDFLLLRENRAPTL